MTAETIAQFAGEALLKELSATPKPGLVDRRNNGAHTDMDYAVFLASKEALVPFFRDFAEFGQTHAFSEEKEIFSEGRPIGVKAEKAMLAATNGVNTHKGAIFSLGLASTACGVLLGRNQIPDAEKVCRIVMKMTEGLCEKDFSSAKETHGEKAFARYAVTGARGEAETGYRLIRREALPFLLSSVERGMDENEALVRTLLLILSETTDTNLIHRGGIGEAEWVSREAKKRIGAPMEQIEAFDDALIEKNLSPGGCADLLALTYFFFRLEKEKKVCYNEK